MSARRAPKADRQRLRRGEMVARALAKGDVRAAVDGLRALPAGEREVLLPAVGALFRKEVLRAFERAAWGDLATAAARAEEEPRLLATGSQAEAVRWALFWGAARGRALARAERLWVDIREPLERANSGAAREIAEYVAAGAPTPRDRASQERCRLSAPTAPEIAMEHVARARAGMSWPEFARTVWRWLGEAPRAVAPALRAAAGRLAARELALGAGARAGEVADGEPPVARPGRGGMAKPAAGGATAAKRLAGPGEAERFLARLVIEAPEVPPLEAEVFLALRRVWGALGPEGLEAADAATFAAVGHAACRYPGLRSLLAAAAGNLPVMPDASRKALPLLESLLAGRSDPAPELWAKALRVWGLLRDAREEAGELCSCARCREDEGIPAPLLEGLEHLLAGGGLRAFLESAPEAHRFDVLPAIGQALEAAACMRLFDQCWETAGEDLRGQLAEMMLGVVQRMQSLEHIRTVAAAGDLASLRGASRRESAEMLALLDEIEEHPMRLRGDARRIWEQIRDRVLPCDSEFLYIALEVESGTASWMEAARQYLGPEPDLDRWLDALDAAALAGDRQLFLTLAGEFLDRYGSRAADLADALLFANEAELPTGFVLDVARCLVAAARRGPVPDTAEFRAALGLARKIERMRKGASSGSERGAGRPGPREKARPRGKGRPRGKAAREAGQAAHGQTDSQGKGADPPAPILTAVVDAQTREDVVARESGQLTLALEGVPDD